MELEEQNAQLLQPADVQGHRDYGYAVMLFGHAGGYVHVFASGDSGHFAEQLFAVVGADLDADGLGDFRLAPMNGDKPVAVVVSVEYVGAFGAVDGDAARAGRDAENVVAAGGRAAAAPDPPLFSPDVPQPHTLGSQRSRSASSPLPPSAHVETGEVQSQSHLCAAQVSIGTDSRTVIYSIQCIASL